MKKLSTFEDIFNKLYREYKDKDVEVKTMHNELIIANFVTTINDITIIPIEKNINRDPQQNHMGLIKIENISHNNFSIPFVLGFNTMEALFFKNGVTIKSNNIKFIIKKINTQRQLA